MSSSILAMPKLILAGVVLVAAGSVVWHTARAPLLVDLAQLERDHTREKLKTIERNTELLQAAIDRGDQLLTVLEVRQDQINQLAREKRDALNKVTTGLACLGEPALRLLNSAPGLRVSGLAPAVSGAAAAGAAPAPDTDIVNVSSVVSTDTDIAAWAIDAGAQYEVCRARLDALIDWHLAPAPPATTESQHP